MTKQYAELTISADVDGDGVQEEGVFQMVGNLQVVPGLRTGYLIGGRGSTVNSIISSTVGAGQSNKQGFYLDLGGGARTVEVNFRGWEGAEFEDESGTVVPVQWGTDPNPSKTKASATGQDSITQIDVLMKYLTVAEIDSRQPATLEYGEYASNGLYQPLDVVVEGPQFTRAAEDGSWFDGSMTLVSAADLNDAIDALERSER